jgi:hypothetical protein
MLDILHLLAINIDTYTSIKSLATTLGLCK